MIRIAILAVCACVMSGCAHLPPAQTWPEFVQRVGPGTPVAVTAAGGSEVRGRVSAVSATSLTVRTANGSRSFDATDVRHVRRDGDRLWNGLAIGAAIGTLGAILPDNRCSGHPPTCADTQVPERLTFLAVATAAGVGIDALRRDRTSLYESHSRLALRIVPALGPGQRALSITIAVSGGGGMR
jgi:hypothetical protein